MVRIDIFYINKCRLVKECFYGIRWLIFLLRHKHVALWGGYLYYLACQMGDHTFCWCDHSQGTLTSTPTLHSMNVIRGYPGRGTDGAAPPPCLDLPSLNTSLFIDHQLQFAILPETWLAWAGEGQSTARPRPGLPWLQRERWGGVEMWPSFCSPISESEGGLVEVRAVLSVQWRPLVFEAMLMTL